jgi:hypothetical protein
LFCAASTFGQKIAADNVPQEVLSAFRAKFPAATEVQWMKAWNANYEVQFALSGNKERSEFDAAGVWVETENPIDKADLPKTIKDAVLKKNPKCEIAEADEIESGADGKLYEVGCATPKGQTDYRVSPGGKIEDKIVRK